MGKICTSNISICVFILAIIIELVKHITIDATQLVHPRYMM